MGQSSRNSPEYVLIGQLAVELLGTKVMPASEGYEIFRQQRIAVKAVTQIVANRFILLLT